MEIRSRSQYWGRGLCWVGGGFGCGGGGGGVAQFWVVEKKQESKKACQQLVGTRRFGDRSSKSTLGKLRGIYLPFTEKVLGVC